MTMMMTMLDGLSRATDVAAADSGSSLPLTPTWHHKTPKNYKKNARHSSAIYFKITLCFREELSQCLQDNSPTNQLVISQVTDWSTRRQQILKNHGITILYLYIKPNPNPKASPIKYWQHKNSVICPRLRAFIYSKF